MLILYEFTSFTLTPRGCFIDAGEIPWGYDIRSINIIAEINSIPNSLLPRKFNNYFLYSSTHLNESGDYIPGGVCVPSSNTSLQKWRNGHDNVSNHQPHDCLLNRLLRPRSMKPSKTRVTGLCPGNSPVNPPHKWPVTQKMFPFDDVIMYHEWASVH